jgi:hypothetical protein
MSLEAKRFRHVAVAVSEVSVSRPLGRVGAASELASTG